MRQTERLLRRSALSTLACAIAATCGTAQAQFKTDRPLPAPLLAQRLAPQPAATIRVAVDRDSLPADGQTPAKLDIQVLDRDGRPLPGETVLTLESSAGRLQLPGASSDQFGLAPRDLDAAMPGFQLMAKDGAAQVWLLAPIEPQRVQVQVSAGAAVAKGEIGFVPALREMIAVGLVEGIVSFDRKNPLSLSQARPEDGFEDEIRNWSRRSGDGKRSAALRTAFFLKGKVRGDALLTMAYDSDKPDRDRLFRDLDPERWYPVYGDASIVGFEARSNSRLYLRLDKDRNYLLYGDIVTGDGFSQRNGQGSVAPVATRELGQYHRAMTGLRAHAEGARGALDVFAAYDNLRQVIEEFPGRGLSGPYTVSNSAGAVLGSERVEMIVRDRHAPSRIVEVKPMQRFVDYNFEPFSGRILFAQSVPSVDAALNPVSVRISYEVDQGGERYWVYGANGQYRVNERFELGGSYVKDENPLSPYELASANASVHFGERTWLSGEVARSRSAYNTLPGLLYTALPGAGVGGGPIDPLRSDQVEGDAWRLAFGHRGEHSDIGAYYGESDAGFNNPASSFIGGRKQGGLDAQLRLDETWGLYAQGTHVEDTVSDARRDQLQAGVRYTPNEAFTLEVGANRVDERAGRYGYGNGLSVPAPITAPFGVGVVSPGFGGGFYGGSPNAINPGTGQTLYNTGYGWSGQYGSWVGNGLAGVPVEYTALRVAAQWRVDERFDLSAEAEQDLDHSEHRRAALGAGLRVHDKTRLYGRYEWNTGLASVATAEGAVDAAGRRHASPYESNAFVYGLDTEYMDGGTVFSEYRMYDAYGARQLQWANGLRNRWRVTPALSLQTGLEKLQVLDGRGQQATAASLAAEWRPDELWLISGRLEWRRSDNVGDNVLPNDPVTGLPTTVPWLSQGYDTWLSTFTLARKLNRDWTGLLRNYHLRNRYDGDAQDSYEDRFQLGFAYRDTDCNRLNVLGKYEFWTRRDSSLANSGLGSGGFPVDGDDRFVLGNEGFDKHVLSVHADWHPSRPWWLSGRLAGKRQRDYFDGRSDRYTAYLASGRLTYDVSERWDVSALAAQMWSPGGARQYAFGAELGYLVKDNLWLSAGYNLRGFRDDDLTQGEYTNQGAYLRLRFKFDETLFRGNDPATNPALPR
ncbi:hypothetical protein [Lysobacter antibioticus]|uniref:hypothetical protein n=1 Tax=Lysobacter antibioticus TaxID=84531 RepID=UPI00068B4BDF|nr:hypothetical protein [Lysobacter antibioticus]